MPRPAPEGSADRIGRGPDGRAELILPAGIIALIALFILAGYYLGPLPPLPADCEFLHLVGWGSDAHWHCDDRYVNGGPP